MYVRASFAAVAVAVGAFVTSLIAWPCTFRAITYVGFPQVVKMITSVRDNGGRNLLVAALESGNVQIVGAFVKLIDGYKVASEQVTDESVKQRTIVF